MSKKEEFTNFVDNLCKELKEHLLSSYKEAEETVPCATFVKYNTIAVFTRDRNYSVVLPYTVVRTPISNSCLENYTKDKLC